MQEIINVVRSRAARYRNQHMMNESTTRRNILTLKHVYNEKAEG